MHGGLGNQLFQYATGRALALRLGCEFRIDSRNTGHRGRPILINQFNITAKVATPEQIKPYRIDVPYLQRKIYKLLGYNLRKENEARINDLSPDELAAIDIAPINNDYYFEGFYVSEHNFIDYANEICSEFTLREPFTGKNADIANEIANCNSVSLHIRRGDYYEKRHIANFGIPLADYCHKAMRVIAERVEKPKYYVFSDDFKWVRESIKFDTDYKFVENNRGNKAHFDLVLMSRCRHNIISNSTFSWWGAWLGSRIHTTDLSLHHIHFFHRHQNVLIHTSII
jgi:hypothetical protein